MEGLQMPRLRRHLIDACPTSQPTSAAGEGGRGREVLGCGSCFWWCCCCCRCRRAVCVLPSLCSASHPFHGMQAGGGGWAVPPAGRHQRPAQHDT